MLLLLREMYPPYLLPYPPTVTVIKLENNETLVNITKNKDISILPLSFLHETINYQHVNVSFQELPKLLEPETMNEPRFITIE